MRMDSYRMIPRRVCSKLLLLLRRHRPLPLTVLLPNPLRRLPLKTQTTNGGKKLKNNLSSRNIRG
jgi:hypothetical protein